MTGTLGIDVAFAPNAAAGVRFAQPRAVPLERLLVGCAPKEAVMRVGSLFALCGTAHSVASASAIEAALQILPSADVRRARLVLAAAEALREHFLRIAMDWTAFLGRSAQPAQLKPATEAFARLKTEISADAFLPGAVTAVNSGAIDDLSARLANTVRDAVFGLADAPMASVSSIASWVCGSPAIAADMLAVAHGGSAPVQLPEEATVLGRWQGDARLTGSEGSQRVTARLLEIDALCRSLSGAADIEDCCRLTVRSGNGASASIDVARGRLQHDLEIEGGKIAAYAISAPTARNFEPGGAAEQAIARIRTDDRAAFERLARLAILEIDPCVAYDLRFTDA